jgi:hypothetical protein
MDGSTAVEKRAIFFKRLLPLLEFGRERECPPRYQRFQPPLKPSNLPLCAPSPPQNTVFYRTLTVPCPAPVYAAYLLNSGSCRQYAERKAPFDFYGLLAMPSPPPQNPCSHRISFDKRNALKILKKPVDASRSARYK